MLAKEDADAGVGYRDMIGAMFRQMERSMIGAARGGGGREVRYREWDEWMTRQLPN
jgi:hypothetical protein